MKTIMNILCFQVNFVWNYICALQICMKTEIKMIMMIIAILSDAKNILRVTVKIVVMQMHLFPIGPNE